MLETPQEWAERQEWPQDREPKEKWPRRSDGRHGGLRRRPRGPTRPQRRDQRHRKWGPTPNVRGGSERCRGADAGRKRLWGEGVSTEVGKGPRVAWGLRNNSPCVAWAAGTVRLLPSSGQPAAWGLVGSPLAALAAGGPPPLVPSTPPASFVCIVLS